MRTNSTEPAKLGRVDLGWLPLPSRRLTIVDPMYLTSIPDLAHELTFGADRVHVSVRIVEGAFKDERRVGEILFLDKPTLRPTWHDAEKEVPVDTAGVVAFDTAHQTRWNETERASYNSTYYHGDINVPGNHWYCAMHGVPPPAFRGHAFGHFEAPLPEFDGRCVNALLKQGVLKHHTIAVNADEFSREGAFATRVTTQGFGWLRLDGEEAAVVTGTGYGDGCYPLEVAVGRDGLVCGVRIKFIDTDE